jgi:tripartite-type tricarboxylate transporter receptor subunit TctC
MLAATGATRSSLIPDVPTLAELGLDEVDASAWVGLVAPAALPETLQEDIRAAVVSVLNEPDLPPRLAALFLEPVGGTPAAFRATMERELMRWRPIIETRRIRID